MEIALADGKMGILWEKNFKYDQAIIMVLFPCKQKPGYFVTCYFLHEEQQQQKLIEKFFLLKMGAYKKGRLFLF